MSLARKFSARQQAQPRALQPAFGLAPIAGLIALLLSPALAGAQTIVPTPGSIGAPVGLTAIGVGNLGANAQPNSIYFGLRNALLYSDNLNLQANGQQIRGMMLQVSPYLNANYTSQKLVAQAYYNLNFVARSNDGATSNKNNTYQTLGATANWKVNEDHFHVLGAANLLTTNTNPFLASSYTPGAQAYNVSQYSDLSLAPTLFGRIDGDGRWNTRYIARYVDPGGSISSSVSQALMGDVRSDFSRRSLGVSAKANYYNIDFDNGFSYNGGDADFLVWLIPNRTFRVGAGVGYAQSDALYNTEGQNSGVGPATSVEWVPDDRTSFRAFWANRYFGNTGNAQARHVASNWTFGLNYYNGVSNGNNPYAGSGYGGYGGYGAYGASSSALTGALTGATGNAPGGSLFTNPVAQGLANRNLLFGNTANNNVSSGLFGPNPGYGANYLNSPILYVDNLTASIGYFGARLGFLATAFMNKQSTAVPFIGGSFNDLDQYGGSVGASYQLDSVSSLNAGYRQTNSDSSSANSFAILNQVLASWDYRFTPRAVWSIGARLQRQSGTGTTVQYDETAVFTYVDFRF
jgi:uncharacterized protein (PEP-CTERM system associated)